MNFKTLKVTVSAFALSLGFSHLSFAFDQSQFLEKLETAVEVNGTEFSYGEVTSEGNVLTLGSVRIANPDKNGATQIESLVFNNPEETEDGGYSYDDIEANNVVRTNKTNSKIFVEQIAATGLTFTSSDDGKLLPQKVDQLTLTNVQPASAGKEKGSGITIPKIEATGFVRLGLQNFTLASARIAPFQGRTTNKNNDPVDISFDGFSLSNLERFAPVGFQIGKVDLGAFSINSTSKDGPVSFSFQGMEVENYYAWDPSAENRSIIPDGDISLNIKPMELSIAGKQVVDWEGGYGLSKNSSTDLTADSEYAFNGISIDFGALPLEGKQREQLKPMFDMGYQKITLNISMKAFMDLKNGLLDISDLTFDIADAGSFGTTLKITGYTEQVLRNILKVATNMSNETDPNKRQAQSMQMLGAFAPLSIQTMDLTITDASLLNKLVALQAAKLNQEPAQVSGIIAPMATIMLAPFNIPEFASSASNALGIFMQGNKTIKASIAPDNGLAFTEIMALAAGVQAGSVAPKEVIDRLNLNVDAN